MAVDTKFIRLLDHKDPQQRRKAIIALADSRDLGALGPLENVSRKDPDPKLRDLAGRAAQHLKTQAEKIAAAAASAEEAEAPVVRVSEKQMARARSFIDEAMSMIVIKDMGKATKALAKALQVDPSVKNDQYFLSLVGQVFDTTPEEGLQRLRDGSARGEFIKDQQKNKIQRRKDTHRAKTVDFGWPSTIFDLIVYSVVIGLITFLSPFVFTRLITQAATYQESLSREDLAEETFRLSRQMTEMTASVETAGVGPILITALIIAVISGVSMLILGFVIHLIATRLFGGVGTMHYMMSQLVPFYSLTLPAFFIWVCIIMVLIAVGAGLIGALCMPIIGLANLIVFFRAAGRVGNAYDFGAAKGCLSITLASFLLSLIGSLISYMLFGTALNAAFGSMGLG